MKKSIIISIFILALCTPSWGCAYMGHSHNNYMFSVFRHEDAYKTLFTDRLDEFWKTYTKGEVEHYQYNAEQIEAFAKKKGDTEMMNYLKLLNQYLEISDQLAETWDYPTKQQLQQRKMTLNNMVMRAKSYKGARLKPQYQLLQMRANMVLGQHQANVAFWEQTGKKLPASVYRDMMQNIYAGALLHVGRRVEACNIYAEQGDLVSIKWAMRKMRNLGGIKTIYDENPESATINFLVQDFVNNVQETIDSDADKDWIEEQIDHRVILKSEAERFITYAKGLVSSGKTKSPALWMAAAGELEFLFGKYKDAIATLNKAVDMNGTPRMKDNARAIRMVVSVKPATLNKEYNAWIANEIKWLGAKIKEESPSIYQYNHYEDILDRLVYNNLVPKYKENGQLQLATALLGMMENTNRLTNRTFEDGSFDRTEGSYSNEYFQALDEMTPKQLVEHKQYIFNKGGDALEQIAKSCIKIDETYFNDLIGTCYLANNQFAEAINYLSKVPASFMEQQNISYYVAHRDYTKPRWMGKQKISDNDATDGPGQGSIRSNKKLDFCKEMVQLQERYTLANAETRQQLAYDLATRYLQASYKGDCWWLTRYGVSVYDTARVDRPDFVKIALDYLNESVKNNTDPLHLNSLYAIAYIPIDPWCEEEYDWENNRYIYKPIRGTRQYKAYSQLNQYVNQKGMSNMPRYVQKCDVLKAFRQNI